MKAELRKVAKTSPVLILVFLAALLAATPAAAKSNRPFRWTAQKYWKVFLPGSSG